MKHLILAALAAASTVTFNSTDGTGSAGFCDVQAAFGWTSDQMAANAEGVTFAAETVDSYAATCTGGPRHASETQYPVVDSGVVVNSFVAYYAMTPEYPEGSRYTFTGYGNTFTSGVVPVIGAACTQGGGAHGTWTAVEKSNSISGLFAHYGASRALIY